MLPDTEWEWSLIAVKGTICHFLTDVVSIIAPPIEQSCKKKKKVLVFLSLLGLGGGGGAGDYSRLSLSFCYFVDKYTEASFSKSLVLVQPVFFKIKMDIRILWFFLNHLLNSSSG